MRQAAAAAACAWGSIAGWEAGRSSPDRKALRALDRAYSQEGALVAAVIALQRSHAVPSDRDWAANPAPGPVWGWFRAPVATEAHLTWGPWRCQVDVPGGPAGIVITSPVAAPNPPLLVRFEATGRFDIANGSPPAWLPTPVVDGLQIVEPQPDSNPTLHMLATRLHHRPGPSAARALDTALGLRLGVARQILAHAGRRPELTPQRIPTGATDWPELLDRRLAIRAREASGLGTRSTVEACRELPHAQGVTLHALRRLEADGVASAETAACLDMHHGLDGRLACTPVGRGAQDYLVAQFPPCWVGPIWVAFIAESGPHRRANLVWEPHRKTLELDGPCVVTCRQAHLASAPLIVEAPGWSMRAGIGRHPNATDVNASWGYRPEAEAHATLRALKALSSARAGFRSLVRSWANDR